MTDQDKSFRARVEEVRAEREEQNRQNPNWPGYKIMLTNEHGQTHSASVLGCEVTKTDDGFVEVHDDEGELMEAYNERFVVGYKPRDG